MALYRPYIRREVRQEVENRAQKNEKGQFLDANTGKAIEGKYDLGHKPGHEFRKEVAEAEHQGLTQKEFNQKMNNPDLYQIEDPSSNRSHFFEEKESVLEDNTEEENSEIKENLEIEESTETEENLNIEENLEEEGGVETEEDNSEGEDLENEI